VQTLLKTLKQKLENANRVAILGIGSELRGDDVAGILTARQIEKTTKDKATAPHVQVFIGETAPENLTGEIKRFEPTHLIIIDSADLDKEPGQIEIINSDSIGGTSFCTHSLPNNVMTDYLHQSFNFELITIGIQPKSLAVGANPSKEVLRATKRLSTTIAKLLNNS
jgi:hydrogenase 3 maturation protease